jgi:hypothetical protein
MAHLFVRSQSVTGGSTARFLCCDLLFAGGFGPHGADCFMVDIQRVVELLSERSAFITGHMDI